MDGKRKGTFNNNKSTETTEYVGRIMRNGQRYKILPSLYYKERSRVRKVWEEEEYLG